MELMLRSLLRVVFELALSPPERVALHKLALVCRAWRCVAWDVRRFRTVLLRALDVNFRAFGSVHTQLETLTRVELRDAQLVPRLTLSNVVWLTLLGGRLLLEPHNSFARVTQLRLLDVDLSEEQFETLSESATVCSALWLRPATDVAWGVRAARALAHGFPALNMLSVRKGKERSRLERLIAMLTMQLPPMTKIVSLDIFMKLRAHELGAILLNFPNVNVLAVGGNLSDHFL